MYSIQIGFTDIVLMFAILQTLLLACVLLADQKTIPVSSYLLCGFLLLLSLILLEFVLVGTFITLLYPQLLGISLSAYVMIAPVFYLYTRSLTGETLKTSAAWHLLPWLAVLLLFIPFYLSTADAKVTFMQEIALGEFERFPLFAVVMLSLISFQTIFYFYRAYECLDYYETNAKTESASSSIMAANWLKKVSNAFSLFVVFYFFAAAELFFFYPYQQTTLSPDILSLGIAFFIFLVSWQMYRQPALFALYNRAALPMPEQKPDQGKYEKNRLADDQIADYQKRLSTFMQQEKPYLDGEIRLSQLAEALEMPTHHLSQVINTSQNMTFFDFINKYRINHAKILLADNDCNILNAALDSGFNSKATFNRVFKRETGLTPSAFKKQQGKKWAHLARQDDKTSLNS